MEPLLGKNYTIFSEEFHRKIVAIYNSSGIAPTADKQWIEVNPSNGHPLLALEEDKGNGVDVYLTESTDGRNSRSTPIPVNDQSTGNDGTDQFQPTVAASLSGTVVAAFYGRRFPCPTNDPNIVPQDGGNANFCINTSI